MAIAVTAPLAHPVPAAPAPDGLLSPALRSMTIGLVLLVTMGAFEALAVATVMPQVQEDLGGIRLYGWTFSGFLLASMVGITLAGEQSDARGPAAPLAASLVLFAAGLAIGGAAPSMAVLVLARVVQGVGAGGIVSIAYVVIGRGYDERVRPRMFAVLSSSWIVPALIGPAIAGVAADFVSWRIVFLGLLPLVPLGGLLTIPALRRLGPPPLRPARPSNVLRALQLALGAGLVLGGIAFAEPLPSMALGAGGIAVAFPALRRLLPAGTLRGARGLPSAVLVMGAANMVFFGVEAYVPYLITSVRDGSSIMSGLALTSAALGWTAASWSIERAKGRVSARAFAVMGLLLVALGAAGMAGVVLDGVPPAVAVAVGAVGGAGMGLAYPTIGLVVLGAAEPGSEGSASASMRLAEVLGAATGAGIGGGMLAAGNAGGWEGGALALFFVAAGALAALAIIAARRLDAG